MWRKGLITLLSTIILYVPIIRANDSLLNVRVTDAEALLASQVSLSAKTEAIAKLESLLSALIKKQQQYKSEEAFVEYLYYFTHRKLLKKYDQYASLSETLSSGKYDCLTATAVYSILLTELSIEHEVVETNYHVYILINPKTEKEILLESTDPNNGLITNINDIQDIKNKYRTSNSELALGQINLNINVERTLKNKELIGLLYYNQSVREINKGNWIIANEFAKSANDFYPNIRVSRLISFIDTSFRSVSL